jgi:hypothetical protein
MSTQTTRVQAEKDDYNVRHYSFHIYFAYCFGLYTAVGLAHFYDPELLLRTHYGFDEPLGVGGVYFARQTGGLMLVMALLTSFAWVNTLCL